MRAGVGLDSIVYHWQIVLRGHRGSQVRYLKLQFWPSSGKRPRTCPLLCLRIPHLKDHGVPRNQVSSIRGRYSTLHGDPLPGSVSYGGSLIMCLGVDIWFLDNGLQLNSTKSEAQGRVFPSWSPSPCWISAMVMWRSGTKSKSLVSIWTQHCQ